jgi:hypothetical protein
VASTTQYLYPRAGAVSFNCLSSFCLFIRTCCRRHRLQSSIFYPICSNTVFCVRPGTFAAMRPNAATLLAAASTNCLSSSILRSPRATSLYYAIWNGTAVYSTWDLRGSAPIRGNAGGTASSNCLSSSVHPSSFEPSSRRYWSSI